MPPRRAGGNCSTPTTLRQFQFVRWLTERFGMVRCMTEGDEWITQAVVSVERCIEELVQGF